MGVWKMVLMSLHPHGQGPTEAARPQWRGLGVGLGGGEGTKVLVSGPRRRPSCRQHLSLGDPVEAGLAGSAQHAGGLEFC